METGKMNKRKAGSYLATYIRYMSPSVYALLVYSAYTILNGILISRWVDATAMGAMNIASPFLSVINAYSLIFGVGGSTVISIYKGRGETDTANRVFTFTVVCLLGSLLLIALGAFLFVKPLAGLLGATPENTEYVLQYLRPITLLCIVHGGSYALGILVKTDGYPLLALVGATASAAMTVLGLFVFTKLLHWGIAGAAWACNVGQIVIFAIYFGHFLSKRRNLRFVRFTASFRELWRIFRIGIPDAISEGSSGIFVLVFNHLVFRVLGETGIIAFSVVNYMNLLTVQLMLGIAQGMQPLVSYHHGAGQPDACRRYRRYALYFAMGFSLLLFAVSFFGTNWLVSLFIRPEEATAFAYAVRAMKLFSWSLPVLSITVVLIGFFAAIEKNLWSQLLSWARGIVLIIALGFAMSRLWGETGLWLSPVVTEVLVLLAGLFFLLRLNRRSEGFERAL